MTADDWARQTREERTLNYTGRTAHNRAALSEAERQALLAMGFRIRHGLRPTRRPSPDGLRPV